MTTKLLAIDVDHTLLGKDRTILPENARAVQDALNLGITVVLASGRFLPTMRGFVHELGLSGPIIAANGSVVYDRDENIWTANYVDPRVFDRVFEFARAKDAHLNVYTLAELLFVNSGAWGEKYLQRVHSILPTYCGAAEARSQPILKLLLADDEARVTLYHEEIAPLLADLPVAITESEAEYLEFLSPVVSKGSALAYVAERLGIDQSQTAAIGDYLNDVEMVAWASFGGAVANARPEVKAVAQVVVASNENAGVAEFIRMLP